MNHPDQVNDRDGVHADTRTPSLIRAPDEFDLVVEGAAEQVTDPATDGAQRDVEVNVAVHGLRKYGAGLRSVVEAFPDFHWDLQDLLIDNCWLGAHLTDTGTSAAGRPVTIQEFAIYRMAGGRIVAVRGDLDKDRLAAI